MAVAWPFLWLVWRHVGQLEDPAYLRTQRVVVVSDRVIERRSAPIGHSLGSPIAGSLTFMGMRYRFDSVIAACERENIAAGELYLEPGLVYVTESSRAHPSACASSARCSRTDGTDRVARMRKRTRGSPPA
jgi:hypothetical protein